jgi:glycine cleavage system H protein
MSNPSSLKYADTHEWVNTDDSKEFIVGITDHAQDLLGDVVFADLPEVGQRFSAKEECMLLESDSPELINEDSFNSGWLFKFIPDNADDCEALLSSEDYESSLDQ